MLAVILAQLYSGSGALSRKTGMKNKNHRSLIGMNLDAYFLSGSADMAFLCQFSPSGFINQFFFPRGKNKTYYFRVCKTGKEHTDLWVSLQIFHQYACIFLDTFPCNFFVEDCAQKHFSVSQDKIFQCHWIENSRNFFHCVDSVQNNSYLVMYSQEKRKYIWEIATFLCESIGIF